MFKVTQGINIFLWKNIRKAPLSMGFPRQEYWSGLPLPTPGGFPLPGIKLVCPASPALQVDSLLTELYTEVSAKKNVGSYK